MNIIVAFITGLTTGGLGCLAVQSGLLATTLAYQVELDMQDRTITTGKFKPHIAQPILLFLVAKLIAYTILGALLGMIGSALQLTPVISATLYLMIGLFMIGNGLRMLNVHPIFRYFVIEPPKFLTRYIRKKSKNRVSMVTPLFMGTLTIFLPCGVTQAMMAAALVTGSPLLGAEMMFAFILGTTPLFFSVSYFATRLGASVEKYFTKFVAVTLLILGLISIDSGLNLAGSPLSFSGVIRGIDSSTGIQNSLIADKYAIQVTENGYSPQTLHMPANRSVSLEWVTKNTQTCARSVVIPALKYQKILPSTGRVKLDIEPQKSGTVIRYTCSMGMYPSQLVFDLE